MTEYDACIARAIAALAAMLQAGDPDILRREVMTAAGLRGGLVDVDGEQLVNKGIWCDVLDEVLERFMAHLAAKLEPRVERISPEAAVVVDEALADTLASLRADIAAVFASL
jgi:hypothetical protein